jgi:gliding motility-associated-like protein
VAASASVTVNSNPAANTSGNVTVTSGNSTTLGASGGGTYVWSNGSTSSVISVAPVIATKYCVTVTKNNCTDTACATVYVEQHDCTPTFALPSAFSPNGDNANDVFKIFYGSTQCLAKFEFRIYDRWGELVFESTDPMAVWDGTYNGKAESTAVFVYYLKATLTSGSEVTREGNISLIR